MDISLDQWHAKIRLFRQKVHSSYIINGLTGCSPLLACIIAAMLLIGVVELNPGPTVAEITKKLDQFIVSFQNTCEQRTQINLPTLSTRWDAISVLLTYTKEAIEQQTCVYVCQNYLYT